jgi:hypothetical protein
MSGTVLITDYGFKNVDLERATIDRAGFLGVSLADGFMNWQRY